MNKQTIIKASGDYQTTRICGIYDPGQNLERNRKQKTRWKTFFTLHNLKRSKVLMETPIVIEGVERVKLDQEEG
jgi:hypothetical protein